MKLINKCVLVLVAILTVSTISMGQNAQVRGNVYDKDSGEPVPFANVYLESTTKGTTTDLDGFYTLTDIEPGDYFLVSTFIGYDTARVEIKLTKNDIEYTSLYLSESSVNIGTVNISASRQTDRTELKYQKLV